ncbi:hypothetical protein Hanom_Chr02g00129661 [Helianthus anomalus]
MKEVAGNVLVIVVMVAVSWNVFKGNKRYVIWEKGSSGIMSIWVCYDEGFIWRKISYIAGVVGRLQWKISCGIVKRVLREHNSSSEDWFIFYPGGMSRGAVLLAMKCGSWGLQCLGWCRRMLWKLVYEKGFGNEMELVAAVEEGLLDGMLREDLAGMFKRIEDAYSFFVQVLMFASSWKMCFIVCCLLARAESG